METQFVKKLNKTETGFHILSLIVRVDGRTLTDERIILDEFLCEGFDDPIELIKEQAFINALPEEEFDAHYIETVEHFFAISTAEERHRLFHFAMKTCMADQVMHPMENRYIGIMMNQWDIAR